MWHKLDRRRISGRRVRPYNYALQAGLKRSQLKRAKQMLSHIFAPVHWAFATKKRKATTYGLLGLLIAAGAWAYFNGLLSGGGGGQFSTGSPPTVIVPLEVKDMPVLLEPAGKQGSSGFGTAIGSQNTGDGSCTDPVQWTSSDGTQHSGSSQQNSCGEFALQFDDPNTTQATYTSITFQGVTTQNQVCGAGQVAANPAGPGYQGTTQGASASNPNPSPVITAPRTGWELPSNISDSFFIQWPDGKITYPPSVNGTSASGTPWVLPNPVTVAASSTVDGWGNPGSLFGPGNGAILSTASTVGDGYPTLVFVDDGLDQTCLSGQTLTAWFTASTTHS